MSKKINIDESFELEGKWQFFDPNLIENRNESVQDKKRILTDKSVPGVLTYDADKKCFTLKVSSFEDFIIQKYDLRDSVKIPCIYGVVSGNQHAYLYDCYLSSCSLSFPCFILLMDDRPFAEEDKLSRDSWKNLRFTKATVEYKNLSYWGAVIARQVESNYLELHKEGNKEDRTLKMELNLEATTKKISNTLTCRNKVKVNNVPAFKNGIQGYVGAQADSYIEFDFMKQGQGLDLKDILYQVNFLEMLLHFAMLPRMSTYKLSMRVVDKGGKTYQFLCPTPYLPREKDVKRSSPHDCFIPSSHLEKIGECFEEYKCNERAGSLFDLFTKPSYEMGGGRGIDMDALYLYMFMSLECAYRLIKDMSENKQVQHEEMVNFFSEDQDLRSFIEKCKGKDSKKVLKVLENKKLAKDICKIRNDFVHAKLDILKENWKDKEEKISVMYECLTYQIQRKLFKLSDEEIMRDIKAPWCADSYGGPFPRYPFRLA